MCFGEEWGRCWIRQPLGVEVGSPWLLPVGFGPLFSVWGFQTVLLRGVWGYLGGEA